MKIHKDDKKISQEWKIVSRYEQLVTLDKDIFLRNFPYEASGIWKLSHVSCIVANIELLDHL